MKFKITREVNDALNNYNEVEEEMLEDLENTFGHVETELEKQIKDKVSNLEFELYLLECAQNHSMNCIDGRFNKLSQSITELVSGLYNLTVFWLFILPEIIIFFWYVARVNHKQKKIETIKNGMEL